MTETLRDIDDLPFEGLDATARDAAVPSWDLHELHSARRDAERFERLADQSKGLKRWWFERRARLLRWIDDC